MKFGFSIEPISSGKGSRLYTFKKDDRELDEHRTLLRTYKPYTKDTSRLSKRLRYLIEQGFVRRQFFKEEWEEGIGVEPPIYCPKNTGIMRVFCLLWFDRGLIIAGSGGPKNSGLWQDYTQLDNAYEEIFYVWLRLSESLERDGTRIVWYLGGPWFEGQTHFNRETHDRIIPRRN